MKVRTNYVSNSSSSSFVIPFDSTDKGVACYKIPRECYEAVEVSLGVPLDSNKEWYLTRFITCADDNKEVVEEITNHRQSYVYMDGEMRGYPYDWMEDNTSTVNIAPGIFMYASDVPGECITASAVYKKLSKGVKYLYQVQKDGSILLTPQTTDF